MQLVDSRNTFSKTPWLCNPSSILWKVVFLRIESFIKNKISQHYPLIGWAFSNLLTMLFTDCTASLFPLMAYAGRLRAKGVPFSWFRYKRVGISLLKYFKGLGNLLFRSVKGLKRVTRCILWLWKSRENVLVLWFIHIFEDSALTAVESDAKFLTRYIIWKEYHLSIEGISKGYLFCQK